WKSMLQLPSPLVKKYAIPIPPYSMYTTARSRAVLKPTAGIEKCGGPLRPQQALVLALCSQARRPPDIKSGEEPIGGLVHLNESTNLTTVLRSVHAVWRPQTTPVRWSAVPVAQD